MKFFIKIGRINKVLVYFTQRPQMIKKRAQKALNSLRPQILF
jgi:hypothetical protein